MIDKDDDNAKVDHQLMANMKLICDDGNDQKYFERENKHFFSKQAAVHQYEMLSRQQGSTTQVRIGF